MRYSSLALAALALPATVFAQQTPDPARLQADVEKLVSFGTRHTLSDPDHPTRGIGAARRWFAGELNRSEEHTSELQSLMRISYAVFCLKKKKTNKNKHN